MCVCTRTHDALSPVRFAFSVVTLARRDITRYLPQEKEEEYPPLWMRTRSIDRKEEMVLTLAPWPFRLSHALVILPSRILLILTRQGTSVTKKTPPVSAFDIFGAITQLQQCRYVSFFMLFLKFILKYFEIYRDWHRTSTANINSVQNEKRLYTSPWHMILQKDVPCTYTDENV